MTISSPSLLIEVRMFVASDDATVGVVIGIMKNDFEIWHIPPFSVIANAERMSPFKSGMSHFFCCSTEP